jgi:2-polyprenyl-3-methyl-5-hydroxy-6-metoxy-1,4-benzoquinol methylase
MSKCLFCENKDSVPAYYPIILFNNKEFEYKKCTNCQLVYITPSLSNEDLRLLYSLEYHEEFYFTGNHEFKVQKRLLETYKPSGKVLDYGCGDASFLRYIDNADYELHGAEFNPDLVQKLQISFPSINFKTISSLLADEKEKYDIIHLGDVLEHLLNPKEIIEILHRRLKPGGVLFVEGPIEHNFNLAYVTRAAYFKLRKLLQPSRKASMRPFHVLFANSKNQKAFFERTGFRTLHYQLFEWAWPFPGKWQQAKSPKQKMEYYIAKISINTSKYSKSWGNRFYYIGTNK